MQPKKPRVYKSEESKQKQLEGLKKKRQKEKEQLEVDKKTYLFDTQTDNKDQS